MTERKDVRVYERKGDNDWYEVQAVEDHRMLLAGINTGRGQEKWLALALAKAVEAGMVDIDKLEAAFKLARGKAADDAKIWRSE